LFILGGGLLPNGCLFWVEFVTLRLLILGGDLLLCGCLFWVEICYIVVAYSVWRFVTLRLLILGGGLLPCGCLFWVEVCYLAVAYFEWRFVTLQLLILGGGLLLNGCLFWVEVCYLAVPYVSLSLAAFCRHVDRKDSTMRRRSLIFKVLQDRQRYPLMKYPANPSAAALPRHNFAGVSACPEYGEGATPNFL